MSSPPVAQYKFNNPSNLYEDSIGSYDLTNFNGSLSLTDVGSYGPTGHFDGATTLTFVTTPPPVASGSLRTVCVWLYRTRSGSDERLLTNNTGTSNGKIWNLRSSSRIALADSTYLRYGGTVPINVWTHVAMATSGGTTILYINGIAQTTVSNTLGTVNSSNPYKYLGGSTGGFYFLGNMSDFRIYDYQLSGTELLDIYSGGPDLTIFESVPYTHAIELTWYVLISTDVKVKQDNVDIYTGVDTSYVTYNVVPGNTYSFDLLDASDDSVLLSISVTTPSLSSTSVADFLEYMSNDLTSLSSTIRGEIDEYLGSSLTHLDRIKTRVTNGRLSTDSYMTFIGRDQVINVGTGKYLLPFSPVDGSGQSTSINLMNVTYNESSDQVILDGEELSTGNYIANGIYKITVLET